MNPPVIGIIVCASEHHRQFVSEDYISAIVHSGGIPVLIPCTIPPARCRQLSVSSCPYLSFEHYSMLCNGYLFCGGYDISPVLFDEDSKTSIGTTNYRMDYFQLSLMQYLLTLDRPILAICKGMQLLNLALGGTIWQDLTLRPEHSDNHMQTSKFCPEHSVNHMQTSTVRSDVCHKIQILPDSHLGQISSQISSPATSILTTQHSAIPELTTSNSSRRDTTTPDSLEYYVNSFHHQAVHQIGHQLKITAIASDHLIEAIESTTHSFVLGVQWHPESMYHTDLFSKKIFDAFIQAVSV